MSSKPTNKQIIDALLSTEAWAEGLQEQCRKARKLMEGEVSTSPNNQNTSSAVARALANRDQHLIKKSKRQQYGKA